MNIVASDDVAGNITLRLINVPWDQALDIILKSKNLDKRVNGNVILVEPAEKLANTEYIRLSYAKVADVEKLIESSNTRSDKNRYTGSLLSERGTVTVDKRTNTLIIQDTSESIEDIRALVAKIDIPVKQVMIEARIVSAKDTFSKEMGVKWGMLSNGAKDNNMEVDGLNVNLGADKALGSVAFNLLSISGKMLDLQLSAMQLDNKGEVISTPKVLTADKQEATISSGEKIPYTVITDKGTFVEWKDANLTLKVTPNITPDGKIGLNLDIKNGKSTNIYGKVGVVEDTIKTNVLVEDGQTVVLGGVFKNKINNEVSKIPFVADLPYVGKLFRNNKKENTKNELLIFITTKVVNNGVGNL